MSFYSWSETSIYTKSVPVFNQGFMNKPFEMKAEILGGVESYIPTQK
jgi:hypothetical protein